MPISSLEQNQTIIIQAANRMSKDDRYYDMTEAYGELKNSPSGAKEKVVAGLKLLGKGLFNATKYTAVELLPGMVEASAQSNIDKATQALKSHTLTDEERTKFQDILERSTSSLRAAEERRAEVLAREQEEEEWRAEMLAGEQEAEEDRLKEEYIAAHSEPTARPGVPTEPAGPVDEEENPRYGEGVTASQAAREQRNALIRQQVENNLFKKK